MGLGLAQRAGPASLEETWAAETGYDEDGAGRDGLYQRGARCGEEAFCDRDAANGDGGQGTVDVRRP